MGTQFGGETMKELPALPKLPHGEGSFSYHHKKGITSIRLRKRINTTSLCLGVAAFPYAIPSDDPLRLVSAFVEDLDHREAIFMSKLLVTVQELNSNRRYYPQALSPRPSLRPP